MIIDIPETYNWVMFSVVFLLAECFMIGMVDVGRPRMRIYNKEFMAQFNEEHEKAFGKGARPAKYGYPDMGTGYYSQKLSYKDWMEINLIQRAHYNFLESIFIVVPQVLMAGLTLPTTAITLAWIHFVGRIIYTFFYKQKPSGRGRARLFLGVSMLGLLLSSVYSCVSLGLK